jgi:hypothetical protein
LDGDQPVARPLSIQRTTKSQNKHKHTSILRVGFEPTSPVFEREKMVDDLDYAATVVGRFYNLHQ